MKINASSLVMVVIACRNIISGPTHGHLVAPEFGFQLVGDAFQKYLRIPWMTCIKHCKAIRQCQGVNYYFQMVGLCELFTSVDSAMTESKDGVWSSLRSGWDYEDLSHCQSCSDYQMCSSDSGWMCKTATCNNDIALSVAKRFGNRNNVGAKSLYVCNNRETYEAICLDGGSWSNTSYIICACTLPIVKHARLDIAKYDSGIEATIVCEPGYELMGSNNVHCDETSNEWESLEMVNCIKYRDGLWTLVYGKNHGSSGNIYYSWTGEIIDNGDYRNNDFLDNWEDHNIIEIKVEVKDFSDNVVKTLLFNGQNADMSSWYSQDELVESSWTDLTIDGEFADMFNIGGINAYVVEPRETLIDTQIPIRWAILNYNIDSSNNKTINCLSNKVWLAIMHPGIYPCEDIMQTKGVKGHVIVYSDTATGTTWNEGHMALAKMMLIYVKT